MLELSDQEIIKKIKNGEIDFFIYIVRKYSASINRLIESRLFNKDDVDDLVQNTFLSLYKAIDKFDEKKPINPYLFQIAKNELKMYYRSHKKTVKLDEQLTTENNDLLFNDDFDSLLKYLSEDKKKVLKLLSEGYSYQEIAKKMGKPLNTIKTIVRRARLEINKIRRIAEKNEKT